MAVLVIDLDLFRDVNAQLGHDGANEVLIATAHRLVKVCRSEDLVARWGGEEFVVVAELEVADELDAFAQRVCDALRASWPGPAGVVPITASVGAALWPTHGVEAADVLRLADRAVYAAKTAGRDRVAIAAGRPLLTTASGEPETVA